MPAATTGTGVAQIHGPVCAPSSTGPPFGWFVMTSRAPANELSVNVALMVLAPLARPVTSPTMRPLDSVVNEEVMSVPSRSTRRLAGLLPPGTLTSTSAEPPLTRSARFDKVVIVVPAVGLSSLPPQADRIKEAMAAKSAARKRWDLKICLR